MGSVCLYRRNVYTRRHVPTFPSKTEPLRKTCRTHGLNLLDSYDPASLHIIDRLEQLGEQIEKGFSTLSKTM